MPRFSVFFFFFLPMALFTITDKDNKPNQSHSVTVNVNIRIEIAEVAGIFQGRGTIKSSEARSEHKSLWFSEEDIATPV